MKRNATHNILDNVNNELVYHGDKKGIYRYIPTTYIIVKILKTGHLYFQDTLDQYLQPL